MEEEVKRGLKGQARVGGERVGEVGKEQEVKEQGFEVWRLEEQGWKRGQRRGGDWSKGWRSMVGGVGVKVLSLEQGFEEQGLEEWG